MLPTIRSEGVIEKKVVDKMLIKQHQSNTISLSSVTELENEAPSHLSVFCFFFNPDTTSVHTYPVNPAYESVLQRGNL